MSINTGWWTLPRYELQCLFTCPVQVKNISAVDLLAAHVSSKLSKGGIQVLVDVMEVWPLMWHQGNMPSFKLAPACVESLVSSGAAVGSVNNDGRLELSEESRLETVVMSHAGELGAGYMMEQVKPQHSLSRVRPVLVMYGAEVCCPLEVIFFSLTGVAFWR